MTNDVIRNEARRIIRMFNTRDPFKIARGLGIHVIYDNDFNDLKGMYKVIKRSRFIFINGNLSLRLQRLVCAHEIGHDRFHRRYAVTGTLQEYKFHDMTLRPEREANMFACEILIDDEMILELCRYGYSVDQLAREFKTDVNLVLMKIDDLKQQGYNVRAPYIPPSDFLR